MKTVFVTGTDTDAGKTYVSVLLLKAINEIGHKTIGFKPIAAGCHATSEGLRNDDALNLQAAANVALAYKQVNPVTFEAPIAPHIAAANVCEPIDMDLISATLSELQSSEADFLLVEGAGGWRLPIALPSESKSGKAEFLSDFVAEKQLPVVLVVGMKLGCLNHAQLTFEQIKRDNCKVIGWIANQIDPNMACYHENLNSLSQLIDAPLIAEVKYQQATLTLSDGAMQALVK